MLSNKKTDSCLVVNPNEKVATYEEAYSCTSSPHITGPSARCIFLLERADPSDGFQDNVVHYGQKVRFATNPYLQDRKMWLKSVPQSPMHHSPISHFQEVCVTNKECFDTVWEIEDLDPNTRFEANGEPVPANGPILLKHASTCHFLASDTVEQRTDDAGAEYEVSVHSYATNNKSQNLELENKGAVTGDTPSKFQHDQNIWKLVTAPDPTYDSISEQDDLQFTIETLMREVKERIGDRPNFGIARIFRAMDDNGNGQLDVDDFRWGLIDFGITLTVDEAQTLLTAFDKDKNGSVSYDEFLRALKGDINPFREQLILRAYHEKLDKNQDGQVTLEDIAQIYDASAHPDVLEGRKTAEEALRDFMVKWDTQKADGIITTEEFLDYFSGVSCSIDSDDYFEQMMKRAWKLE